MSQPIRELVCYHEVDGINCTFTSKRNRTIACINSKHVNKIHDNNSYKLQGSLWTKKYLTYRINRYTTKLPLSTIDATIDKAFNIWSNATEKNLQFVQVTSPETQVDIDIEFSDGHHNCLAASHDGKGGVLAHAFFPEYGGDIHFDEEEDWTIVDGDDKKTDLLMVSVHEMGHSLGLAHSTHPDAIMAPFYRSVVGELDLHADDIKGIKQLYCRNESTKRSLSPKLLLPKKFKIAKEKEEKDDGKLPWIFNNDEFFDGSKKIDTTVTLYDNENIIFQENKYFSITPSGKRKTGKISERWKGLIPDNLDASFAWWNGYAYLFKGNCYWRLNKSGQVDEGYPKNISDGFSGIPSPVHSVFVWSGNRKIYFVSGDQYWKFVPTDNPYVDTNVYPRPLSIWTKIEVPKGSVDFLTVRQILKKGKININNEDLIMLKTIIIQRDTGLYREFNDAEFSPEDKEHSLSDLLEEGNF